MRSRPSSVSVPFAALGVACSLTAVNASHAGVYAYGMTRTVSYTQSSNAAPTVPETWNTAALVYADVPNEMLSATLTRSLPSPDARPMAQAIPTLRQFQSTFYDVFSTYLAEFPPTTYTITVNRGAGPEIGTLTLVEDRYCAAIPALTGDTYSRLQSYDPSTDFVGTMNGFTLAPGTNSGFMQFVIVPIGGPAVAWSLSLPPGSTSFTIPQGTLLPGTAYSFSLAYTNSTITPNVGFGFAATSSADFSRTTSFEFTTPPENCTITVTAPPASTSRIVGQTLTLNAGASGPGTLSYQWLKEGQPITSGMTYAGSSRAGTSSPTLTITNVRLSDQGLYSCSITNTCGAVTTSDAIVVVRGFCKADFNESGAVSVQDIFDFLSAWFSGCN